MASNVSNAVGTQRQFSAQPQDVYAKRLAQVNGHVAVEAPVSNDGVRLAQSLGVLSEAIDNKVLSKEKNLEKMGVADAEKVAAGMTEEDWRTKKAIAVLNERGDFQTGDNPYAVALIEKMRGKYFSARFDGEYQIWRRDQPTPKSEAEEAGQYQKFMQEKFNEVSAISSNQGAFNAGYYDNFMPQTVSHVNVYIKQKSADLDVNRVAGVSANLGNVTLNYHTMTNEDVTKRVNTIFSEAQLAKATEAELDEHATKWIEGFAERSGDTERLGYFFENVMVPDRNGNLRKLDSVVDMTHAVKIAEVVRRSQWDKKLDDKKNELLQMPVSKIHEEFEKMEKDDNHTYKSLVPLKDSIIRERLEAEEKAKKNKRKEVATNANDMVKRQYIKNRLGLFVNKKPRDVNGKPVEQSIADFQGKVTYIDPETGVKKNVEITQADLDDEIKNQLDYYATLNLPDGVLADKSFELLEWGAAKNYADSFKQVLVSDLGSLSVDKLTKGSDGRTQLSGNLKSAMVMFHSSHDRFANIFGADSAKKVATLDLIRGGTGSLEDAVDIYAKSRSNRESEDIRQKVNTKMGELMPTLALDNFDTLGGSSSIDKDKEFNWDMGERVKAVAEALMYGGYSKEEAGDLAKKYARKTYFSFMDSAIPKSVFDTMTVDDKMTNGRYVLKDTISYFKKANPDVAKTSIWVDYDENTGVYTVNGGGRKPHVWTRQQLVEYGNKRGMEWNEETKDGVFNADQINREKNANQPPPLPEGVYWGI